MTDVKELIRKEWQAFAQTRVFAFRGITPAAYELWAPDYFRAILDRSQLHVLQDDSGAILTALVTERIPGTESTIIHWAWTVRGKRNLGMQAEAFENAGLDPYKSKIFVSHLTVLSEQLCGKYGWLFSPFSLYKGATNVDQDSTAGRQQNTGKSGANADK